MAFFGFHGDKIGFGKDPTDIQDNVADPSGGVTEDVQARAAINDILDILEAYGLMKSA